MNVYTLVEGLRVEPYVYAKWIPAINPNLRQVQSLHELRNNNFIIFSGGGYPSYLKMIGNAVADLNNIPSIDRLVVGVDSEEMTRINKLNEIDNAIKSHHPTKPYHIVVQHYCFETWCLGNRKIAPKPHCTGELRNLKSFFDVSTQDPEQMPSQFPQELGRSAFAFQYLRKCMQDRGITYSKRNPAYVAHPTYFYQIRQRQSDTGHIDSILPLIHAFT